MKQLSLIIACLLLQAQVAWSDPMRFDPHQQITLSDGSQIKAQEALDKALKELGLEANLPQVRAFLAGRGYGQLRAKSGYEPKIKQHIKGSSGIHFASTEEIDRRQQKMLKENMPNVEKLAEEHVQKMMEASEKQLQEYKELPLCTGPATEKVKVNQKEKDPLKTVLHDILILPHSNYSDDDPLKLYGRKVHLLEVSPEHKAFPYQLADSFNMKCLPGRVRLTTDYLFVHYGKDALKNYDEDPYGSGTLDESLR